MTARRALYAVAAAAAAALAAPAVHAQDLVYGFPLPPKHVVNVEGLQPLAKRLKPAIDMQIVPGGQLFGAGSTLQNVGNRVADATLVIPSFAQSRLPNASIPFNALMMSSQELVTQGAAEETMLLDCPECKEDYIRNNAIYLGGYPASGMAFLCNKPVTGREDLAGKKTRISGAIGRWAAYLGAVPVSMNPTDMVEAINRGNIDCIGGFMAWYKSYPVQDAVKWIYSYPMGATSVVSFMTVNLDAWKGLSDSQKRAMFAELPQTSADITFGYIAEAYRARALAEKNGVTITESGPALNELWEKYKKSEYDAIVAAAKKAGSKNPEKVLDTFLANVKKWQGIIDAAGLTNVHASRARQPADLDAAKAKFAALLKEHIYSKIDPTKF